MTGNNLHKDALLWIKIPIKFHELHPKVICCQLYAVEIESQQKICFYVRCKTLDMSFTEMEILTINSLQIINNVSKILEECCWMLMLLLILKGLLILMFLRTLKMTFQDIEFPFTLSSCLHAYVWVFGPN